MAAPILTPSLVKLRNGFNLIAPTRDKESDGWIGDYAHSQGTSGHNPDDMPGVSAERSDSDSIPEVRAIDVDKDLRRTGLTMQQCVQKTLATANDRKRLIYIIWNGVIWSKSSGWAARTYTGANKHDKHAHFSGDPAYDNDTSPWGIEELIDMAWTSAEKEQVNRIEALLKPLKELDGRNPLGEVYTRMALGEDHVLGAKYKPSHPSLTSLGSQLAAVLTMLGQFTGRDFVDEDQIVVGVLAGLPAEKIAAAIPPSMAKQVADELTRRLTE